MDQKTERADASIEPELTRQFDKFARFYDGDYRHYDDDLQLVAVLAEDCGTPILELGCGTGRVMLPLAAQGFSVVGIDISPALLAVAQEKINQSSDKKRITVVMGDICYTKLPRKDFTFAYCVSNTLMHCTTQSEQIQVMQNTFEHLRSDGLFLIDLFNPDLVGLSEVAGLCELADSWEDANGSQVLKWSVRSVDAATQLQETLFIYEEIAQDGSTQKTLCPFTLRFIWPSEGILMLEKAGFEVLSVWGNFDGEPHHSGSERLVYLARKP